MFHTNKYYYYYYVQIYDESACMLARQWKQLIDLVNDDWKQITLLKIHNIKPHYRVQLIQVQEKLKSANLILPSNTLSNHKLMHPWLYLLISILSNY